MFTKNPTVLEVLTEQAPPTPRQVPHAGQGQASHVPFFCSRVRPETGSSSPGRASVGAKAAQGTSMWQEQAPLWLQRRAQGLVGVVGRVGKPTAGLSEDRAFVGAEEDPQAAI